MGKMVLGRIENLAPPNSLLVQADHLIAYRFPR